MATLKAALAAARAVRAGSAARDTIHVQMRDGVYELGEPLVIEPADSGPSAENPLIISAYKNEHPVLSGGTRLIHWEPVAAKPGRWSASVPATGSDAPFFRQLFVNGQRRYRARYPNDGYLRMESASPSGAPAQFTFKPGDIKPEWAGPGDVEVVAMTLWAGFRLPIVGMDESAHVVKLGGSPEHLNAENKARYFIENAAGELDQPGEWYLDRKTRRVAYWAKQGEDISSATVIAPHLAELIRFQGDFKSQRAVRNVIIDGLDFAYSAAPLGTNGYGEVQAAVAMRGALRGEGAEDCIVRNCRFEHLGGYAMDFGRGCQHVRIIGNEIADIGAGGIRLGEQGVSKVPFEECHHNIVSDNNVTKLGRLFPASVGILILQSGGNLVSHNHVHDLFYTAISVGWTWGYTESPCKENIIEFNHLHDIGQGMLSDMGGIYTLGIEHGTVLRNNLIHDVTSYDYGGWGIYTDEGSTDILIERNVVYRTKSAGFHQHYGRENVVRNNIFALGTEHQLMRTREEDHISFTFETNIVYFDHGNLLGSNWGNNRYVMDHNLFFDARPDAKPGQIKFAGRSFADWQKQGHDEHSLIADPLFVAPEKGDFRLKADSPAFKLGFKAIDLRTVGVRPKSSRPEN